MVDAAVPVRAEGLRQSYGSGDNRFLALSVDLLDVSAGEMVMLEGPSGSGKTTLISILGTLLRPDDGRLWVAGREVDWGDARTLERLRSREVGFIFQAFNLLSPLTVRENVEVALNAADVRGRAAKAAALAALDEVGLANRAGDRVNVLSGGEMQRVAIARALVSGPAIILADEPTANLDTERGLAVGATLAELAAGGRAVIVATHDVRLERFATRRLRMVDGRIENRAAPPGGS